jgi:phosphatidylserine/phosphatidylglycerophosphate/cardiolipin synthase-like enzyme
MSGEARCHECNVPFQERCFGGKIANYISKASKQFEDRIFIVNPLIVFVGGAFVSALKKVLKDGVEVNILTTPPRAGKKRAIGRDSSTIFFDLAMEKGYSNLIYRENRLSGPSGARREQLDDRLHARFILIESLKEKSIALVNSNQFTAMGIMTNNELCVPITHPVTCNELKKYWDWLTRKENLRDPEGKLWVIKASQL